MNCTISCLVVATLVCTTGALFAHHIPQTAAQSANAASTTASQQLPQQPQRSVQPDPRYVFVPLNLSFVPGLSIGNIAANGKKIHNGVAFGIIGGWADRLTGVDFNAVLGGYNEDVTGVQGAGVVNIASGNLDGAQGAGAVNIVGGSGGGVQGAGAVNVVGQNFDGVQGAGAVNVIGGSGFGVQGTGAVNVVGKSYAGVQMAGAVNVVGSTAAGVQVAGAVNIAHDAKNIQIAPMNIAHRADGVHIGVVNIADDGDGLMIGLFNPVWNQMRLDIWGDEMGFAHATLRTGTRRFANYLGVAARPRTPNTIDTFAFVYGAGFEFPLGSRAYATVDALGMAILSAEPAQITRGTWGWFDNRLFTTAFVGKLRTTFGFQLFSGCSIFGGVALNFYTSETSLGNDLIRWSVYDAQVGSLAYRVSPGVVFGVRLF